MFLPKSFVLTLNVFLAMYITHIVFSSTSRSPKTLQRNVADVAARAEVNMGCRYQKAVLVWIHAGDIPRKIVNNIEVISHANPFLGEPTN